jgi:hypothetical protein
LIAADLDGLIMVGRCIDGDFIAHAARVRHPRWRMGGAEKERVNRFVDVEELLISRPMPTRPPTITTEPGGTPS